MNYKNLFVVICIFFLANCEQYNLEKKIADQDSILRYKNIGFIAFGGLSEYGKYESIAQKVHTPFLNFSDKGLREFGSIMNYIDLYIGVDTGVTHLMSSYNKPMIALYHPNMPVCKYGPVNHPKLCLLEADQQTHLELDKMALMSTIKPKLVFDKIIKLLE